MQTNIRTESAEFSNQSVEHSTQTSLVQKKEEVLRYQLLHNKSILPIVLCCAVDGEVLRYTVTRERLKAAPSPEMGTKKHCHWKLIQSINQSSTNQSEN